MLETIREYAAERLGEDEPLRRRHAEFFVQLAEQAPEHLEGPDQAVWLDRLEADYPNIRRALAFDDLLPRAARSLSFFWAFRGYLAEGRRAAAAAVGHAPDDAELHFTAGLLAVMQGDYTAGRSHGETSHGSHSSATSSTRSFMPQTCSAARCSPGRHGSAVALLDDALARIGATPTQRGVAIARLNLGYIALVRGDLARAVRELEVAAAVAAQSGDAHAESRALAGLASAALEDGRLEDTIRNARRSLDLSLVLGTDPDVAAWAAELAGAALASTDPTRAARLLGAAERMRNELGVGQSGLELDQHERACAALGGRHAVHGLPRGPGPRAVRELAAENQIVSPRSPATIGLSARRSRTEIRRAASRRPRRAAPRRSRARRRRASRCRTGTRRRASPRRSPPPRSRARR